MKPVVGLCVSALFITLIIVQSLNTSSAQIKKEPQASIFFKGENNTFYPGSLSMEIEIIPKSDLERLTIRFGGSYLDTIPSQLLATFRKDEAIKIPILIRANTPTCSNLSITFITETGDFPNNNTLQVCILMPVSIMLKQDIEKPVPIPVKSTYSLDFEAESFNGSGNLIVYYTSVDDWYNCEESKDCGEIYHIKNLGKIEPGLKIGFNLTFRSKDEEDTYTPKFEIGFNGDRLEYQYSFKDGSFQNAKRSIDINIKTYYPISINFRETPRLVPGLNRYNISIINNVERNFSDVDIKFLIKMVPSLIQGSYYRDIADSAFFQENIVNCFKPEPSSITVNLRSRQIQNIAITINACAYPLDNNFPGISIYIDLLAKDLTYSKFEQFEIQKILEMNHNEEHLTVEQGTTTDLHIIIKNPTNSNYSFKSCGYILDNPHGNLYGLEDISVIKNQNNILLKSNESKTIVVHLKMTSPGMYQIIPYCKEENGVLFFNTNRMIHSEDILMDRLFLSNLPVTIFLVITCVTYFGGRSHPFKKKEFED